MPLHWRAWQTISRRHRFGFSQERFYLLGGIPSPDVLAVLVREQGLKLDIAAVAREKEQEYMAMLPQVKPIQPIVDIAFEHLGKIPLAVASGGTVRSTESVLCHLGIRDWFKSVVTSEAVARQKPAPDLFLEAARRIGVSPENCRAYEDTDFGMQAIRAAGMEAVDVRGLLKSPMVGA
ncbi:MAG: HAD-IA family hydrolase [Candidatus Omnitrophica bacterium]|nr:HAD-IA family hydrolase [Candidatus Omnitrophota bacterium]